MVVLDDEGNLVRVFASHRAQHAQRRGHPVATAFEGQLHDIFRIEVNWVGSERRARGMLDALIHRKDGDVPGARQTAMAHDGL